MATALMEVNDPTVRIVVALARSDRRARGVLRRARATRSRSPADASSSTICTSSWSSSAAPTVSVDFPRAALHELVVLQVLRQVDQDQQRLSRAARDPLRAQPRVSLARGEHPRAALLLAERDHDREGGRSAGHDPPSLRARCARSRFSPPATAGARRAARCRRRPSCYQRLRLVEEQNAQMARELHLLRGDLQSLDRAPRGAVGARQRPHRRLRRHRLLLRRRRRQRHPARHRPRRLPRILRRARLVGLLRRSAGADDQLARRRRHHRPVARRHLQPGRQRRQAVVHRQLAHAVAVRRRSGRA